MKKLLALLTSCLFILIVTTSLSYAQVTLPSIFSDNMVLQQQTDAAFWGKTDPGSKVSVRTSWNGKSYTSKADKDGKWKTSVSTPAAGGPYTVTITGGGSITLKNVLIGEVWVCSGQSNMEMPVKGYLNQPVLSSNEVIATSSNDNIRLITVPHATNLTPVDNFNGSWKLCEPENVVDFSATAYFFGSMLNKILKVPVGLICTSWGGTRIEPWMSEAGLKNFDWVKLPDKTSSPQGNLSPQTPTVLFNAMINPITGYGIRGGIWYQGEANRNEAKEYEKLMPGLVENWRSVWGVGEFPFYYVQIAPYDYGYTGENSAFLREAHLNACFEIAGANKRFYPAVGFITGTGITLMSPSVNEPVAVRYAFKDFIIGDLFNTEGIPASSFRTDDWE